MNAAARQSSNGNVDDPRTDDDADEARKGNILARIFFLWTAPLFWRGNARDLTVKDLGTTFDSDLSKTLGDKLEKCWSEELIKAKHSGRKPKLLKAIIRAFIFGYLFDGFLVFVQSIFCKTFQPVLLALLITQFQKTEFDQKAANLYAGGIVALSLVWVLIHHNTLLRTQQRGMRIRIACCSLLYRKCLRLSAAALSQTTAGQLVNLMSNDVNRFDVVLPFLHHMWIMPIQVVLTCYLIYVQVGWSAIVGVVCVTLQTLPVQVYLSRWSSRLRMKIAQRTDERVRLMSEIISGIQVIKMYAWEKPFEHVVSYARQKEISAIKAASYIRGLFLGFVVFTERSSLYITLLTYCLSGNAISAAIVFSVAQFFNKIQEALAFNFPMALSFGSECLITVKRIENFLMLEEREESEVGTVNEAFASSVTDVNNTNLVEDAPKPVHKKTSPDLILNGCITLNNVVASWVKENNTLSNISLNMEKGKLYAIIGTVGSGKSSFLQLILKELPLKQGSIKVQGEISYANQEPWLFVDTVKNNILFGEPYDHRRYKQVIKVCALEKDFKQFTNGDQTLVGERGVSLSGGQRARINLARAVYKQADIYLLDDPLSAVDTEVGRHLFDECIKDYLSEKTRILVTHQIHYLRAADCIIVLQNGQPEYIGTYDDLMATNKNLAQYIMQDHQEGSEDEDQKRPEKKKLTKERRASSTLVKLNEDEDDDDDQAEAEVNEDAGSGKIKLSVYWKYWMAGGSKGLVFFMFFAMVFGQLTATVSDYWVTFWSNEQNKVTTNETKDSPHEDIDMWRKVGPLSTAEYLYVYTALIIACIFFISSRTFVFFYTCMKSSKGLHDQMFHKILRVKMKFFDENPSGRILNRFSKDIGAVDELLPRAVITMLQIFLVFCSIMVLVAVTNPWFLVAIAVVLCVFYITVNFYLNTAQSVKRLETITRSPVFSHLSSSINGIISIRAFKKEKKQALEFDIRQDVHTRAWNYYISCSCTLGFWIDISCVVFLAVICYYFTALNTDNLSSGNVGLAISQTLILMGMLQFGVQQATEMFAQMTSVERVLQYTKLEEEKGLEKNVQEAPVDWPSNGEISFKDASLKYKPDEPPILKNLNFYVKSGWKVGIVGRTGAGKSSLISALFRLADVEGQIKIDGIDTKDIPLKDLRAKISIIPQEPVLFSASLRYNLDPFKKYHDADLWPAIEAVELKDAGLSLEHHISNGGGNMSLGQRQLVCLARAILRNNHVLVLDEATANVDPETDFFIQKTIREKFAECTVLTIAHRLNTIMDSDRVLVMDSGRVAEFDHPHTLLQNPEGHFHKMVQETGGAMEAKLKSVAREAYEKGVVETSERL